MFVFLARTDPDAIRVRRWIVENFQCKGIVKLPAYTFYSKTPVNASVLFLRKPPAMPGVIYYGESSGKLRKKPPSIQKIPPLE